tara:strand:+ start:187 stop:1038 length:852 start_codon:yes stop_codon:yes gene_type:complete
MKILTNFKLAIIILAGVFSANVLSANLTDIAPAPCLEFKTQEEKVGCLNVLAFSINRHIPPPENVMTKSELKKVSDSLNNRNLEGISYFTEQFLLGTKVWNTYLNNASNEEVFIYLSKITPENKEFFAKSAKQMEDNPARYMITLNNAMLAKSNGEKYVMSSQQMDYSQASIQKSKDYLDSLELTYKDASTLMYFTNNAYQYTSQVYQLDPSKFSSLKGNTKNFLKVYSKEEFSLYSASITKTLLENIIASSKEGSINKTVAIAHKKNAEFYIQDLKRLMAKK